jgi:tape measure domain-containing protein
MPVELAQLEVRFIPNTSAIDRALRDVERRVQESANRANSAMSGIGGGGGGLLGGVLSVFGGNLLTSALSKIGSGFTSVVVQGRDFLDLVERARIAMTTLTGSSAEANKHLTEIIRFGTYTPFKTDELIIMSQRLQAVGFNAEQVIPALTAIGDKVAALGGQTETLERIVRAITDIKTKGRVQQEEIRQLANAGIPAWKYLADELARENKAFERMGPEARIRRVQKLAETGRLNADRVVDVLLEQMESSSKGMMQKIQTTYAAQQETLEDLFTQAAARAMGGTGPAFQIQPGTVMGGIKATQRGAINILESGRTQGVEDMFRQMSGVVMGPYEAVIRGLTAADPRAVASNLGITIPEGIIAGIEAKSDDLKKKATQMVLGALEAGKIAQQSQSPSRKWMEEGYNAAIGYGIGFEVGMDSVRGRVAGSITGLMRQTGGGRGDGGGRGGGGRSGGLRPAAVQNNDYIASIVAAAAARYGVPEDIIWAVMNQESRGHGGAVSPKGASGYMQLMPGTASHYGVKNIFDPQQNIMGGTHYMADLLRMFGGDVKLALAGYNAGEGAVLKYGRRVPPYAETQNYVAQITARLERMGFFGGESQTAPMQVAVVSEPPATVGKSGLTPEQVLDPRRQWWNLPGTAFSPDLLAGWVDQMNTPRSPDLHGGTGQFASNEQNRRGFVEWLYSQESADTSPTRANASVRDVGAMEDWNHQIEEMASALNVSKDFVRVAERLVGERLQLEQEARDLAAKQLAYEQYMTMKMDNIFKGDDFAKLQNAIEGAGFGGDMEIPGMREGLQALAESNSRRVGGPELSLDPLTVLDQQGQLLPFLNEISQILQIVNRDIVDVGKSADTTGKKHEKMVVESEKAAQRLKISWDDVSQGFEHSFTSALDDAMMQGNNFFASFALAFAKMLAQLAAQALAANLSKLIFGYSGEEGSAGPNGTGGGGWLGKLLGFGLRIAGSIFGGHVAGGGASAGVGSSISGSAGAAGASRGLGGIFGAGTTVFGGGGGGWLGGFASGGDFGPGDSFMVGETGAEVIQATQHGRVTPLHRIPREQSGRGPVVNNHYHVHAPTPKIAREAIAQLRQREAAAASRAARRNG